MVENCAVDDCHKREYLAEIARLQAMIQELIDALIGDLSDADGIARRARQLLKE